jgi:pyruvate dehydrogenase E2 component (dihydrolipoamide acetyltransferase)
MAKPVILQKFDMMMEHGVIVRWLVPEGQEVNEGDPLVEIETDKVNMEIEAPAAGILAGVRATPGETVPVATVIAYILQPGESLPAE